MKNLQEVAFSKNYFHGNDDEAIGMNCTNLSVRVIYQFNIDLYFK